MGYIANRGNTTSNSTLRDIERKRCLRPKNKFLYQKSNKRKLRRRRWRWRHEEEEDETNRLLTTFIRTLACWWFHKNQIIYYLRVTLLWQNVLIIQLMWLSEANCVHSLLLRFFFCCFYSATPRLVYLWMWCVVWVLKAINRMKTESDWASHRLYEQYHLPLKASDTIYVVHYIIIIIWTPVFRT